MFFLFTFLGYLGILLFYLIGHRITRYTDKVKILGINIFPWILLYPSLHMYTVMIGKDPLVLLGIALCGYSLTYAGIKKIYLFMGLLILLIIRPHIAIVFLASLVVSFLISSEWNVIQKSILFIFSLVLGIASIPYVIAFFRIEEFSLTAIQLMIEVNTGNVDDATTFVDMTSYPLILKMFTFLYRPLFIDSPNVLLLEYSAENLFFLILSLNFLRLPFFQWISKQSIFLKFALIYSLIGTMVLCNGFSVFGLFIRQKTMVFLFLLTLIFGFIHYRNSRYNHPISSSQNKSI
ncbi:hypothetical protein [Membranihabitans maritimus]|uniref:hypothetical protein n=1 Tax=Membranihabitans maritimus TaxID=2904244 RepID=UPI001F30EC3C|nr:hypothetical protein [Membranihabitans maritimus]